jgi:hypothetical protein
MVRTVGSSRPSAAGRDKHRQITVGGPVHNIF